VVWCGRRGSRRFDEIVRAYEWTEVGSTIAQPIDYYWQFRGRPEGPEPGLRREQPSRRRLLPTGGRLHPHGTRRVLDRSGTAGTGAPRDVVGPFHPHQRAEPACPDHGAVDPPSLRHDLDHEHQPDVSDAVSEHRRRRENHTSSPASVRCQTRRTVGRNASTSQSDRQAGAGSASASAHADVREVIPMACCHNHHKI
jgi:hypothetical protein